MSESQVSLKDYDYVVAVSQKATNDTLSDAFYSKPQKVELYFAYDKQGNFVPVKDPDQAEISFIGTRDAAFGDPDSSPPMIELYVAEYPQSVHYNVTFSDATFTCKNPPVKVSQSQGDKPWVIKFKVDLALQGAEFNDLPTDVKDRIKNLDEDMFSIQQLCLDLDSASLDSYEGVEGLPDIAEAFFELCFEKYFEMEKENNGVLFGYAVTQKNTASAANAGTSMAPTDLDFCISRYRDPTTQEFSNPALDTLNYLVMAKNHPMPTDPPSRFPFNFVESTDQQGLAVVQRSEVVPGLLDELKPFLGALSPIAQLDTTTTPFYFPTLNIKQNTQPVDFQERYSTGSKLAHYEYQSVPPEAKMEYFSATAAFHSSCDVVLDTNGNVTVSGFVSMEWTLSGKQHGTYKCKLPWNADLVFYTAAGESQLSIKVGKHSFNQKPTVDIEGDDWFRDSVQGIGPQYVGLAQRTTKWGADLLAVLEKTFAGPEGFIFPGGKTFSFEDPGLAQSGDLAAVITYQI